MKKALVLLYFFAALFLQAHTTHADAVSLALNWKPEPEFGGFYAARDTEFYKREKLDVTILPGGSGTPVAQMLAAGKADFGILMADELLIARDRGADLTALFAVYQTYPHAIMVHEQSHIKTFPALFSSGMTVAVQKGLPYVSFLEKKYGFAKVKIVPYAGGISQFLTDKNFAQQCFVTSEPIFARQHGAHPQTLLVSDVGYNPYTHVVAAKTSTVKDKRQMVEAFLRATEKGWAAYLKNPSPTNQLIERLNPSMDVKTLDLIAQAQKPLIVTAETEKSGLGYMTSTRWEALEMQLKELKLIEKIEPSERYLYPRLTNSKRDSSSVMPTPPG